MELGEGGRLSGKSYENSSTQEGNGCVQNLDVQPQGDNCLLSVTPARVMASDSLPAQPPRLSGS